MVTVTGAPMIPPSFFVLFAAGNHDNAEEFDEDALHGGDGDFDDHRLAEILDPDNVNRRGDWRGTEVAEIKPRPTPPIGSIDTAAYDVEETPAFDDDDDDDDVLSARSLQ